MTRDLRAKSGRAPRSEFCDFVETLPEAKRVLGLTHVTSSYILRDIAADGAITAQDKCPVIGEPVTYAFYGRAAFRSSWEYGPTTLSCLFPSVLILDPQAIPTPHYVFAFDSGAFVSGMMDSFLHPYMPLFDFLLARNPESAARLVDAVFGDNDAYFRNNPRPGFSVPASNFEADCYRQIVLGAGQGPNPLDDRASTPEFIFRDPIKIEDCIRAAVLPDTLANDPNIGGALRSLGVRIYEYIWTNSSRPVENHFVVRNMVQAAYRDLAWL